MSTRKILVILSHPALEKSRINRTLMNCLLQDGRVTLHDLYEIYPDQLIDPDAEQQRLLDHDLIVFAHPLYWYSCPPLMKHWLDVVLTHGWAYGSRQALAGKYWLSAISASGSRDSYQPGGKNNHSLKNFLLPFQQTAQLCGMHYLPPHAIFGVHRLEDAKVRLEVAAFIDRLECIAACPEPFKTLNQLELLSDWQTNSEDGK